MSLDRAADSDGGLDSGRAGEDLGGELPGADAGDENLCAAVVDDVLGLGCSEVPVHRCVHQAAALGGPRDLEELGSVLHHDGDVVALGKSLGGEEVGEPRGTPVEFGEGDACRTVGENDSVLVGMGGGDLTEVHRASRSAHSASW